MAIQKQKKKADKKTKKTAAKKEIKTTAKKKKAKKTAAKKTGQGTKKGNATVCSKDTAKGKAGADKVSQTTAEHEVEVKEDIKFEALPFRLRYRIACMLIDGATAQAVLKNHEIAKTLNTLGITIRAQAVRGFKSSEEYKKIAAERAKTSKAYEDIRLSAALLRDCEATGAIAERLKLDLLRLVKECIDTTSDDPLKIERLTRSAVTLSKSVHDNQNASLRKRVAALSEENMWLKDALEHAQEQYNGLLEQRRNEWTQVDGNEVADRLSSIFGLT